MDATKTVVALVATMLLVAGGAPTVVGANTADETLDVGVSQGGTAGQPVVTVTQDGSAVEGATVLIDADGYAGAGTYATDADGTVGLPEPLDSVTATVTVTNSGQRVVRTVELKSRDDSLMVDVGHGADGTATVTVRRNGTPVSDATVTVTADRNYSGTGTYTTDTEGSVALPAPNETTRVAVQVSAGEQVVTKSATLPLGDLEIGIERPDDGPTIVTVTRGDVPVENATVVVDSVADYGGVGNYTTDADGRLTLPEPNATVVVTLETGTAGNSSAKTVTLRATNGESVAYGQRVSSFVHGLLGGDRQGGIGQQVSAWVHGHHPHARSARGPHPENGAAPHGGRGSEKRSGPGKSHGGNGRQSGNGHGQHGGNAGNAHGSGHGPSGAAHAAGSASNAPGKSHAKQAGDASNSKQAGSSSKRRPDRGDAHTVTAHDTRGWGYDVLARTFGGLFGNV